ncbi:hypothetical protein BDP27DRAFT_1301314 [Rhodocollybia butyracea]|uniref:Hydrophobin n=1 Tax=Rhodocollybia butyracea TaxID=206335 RepID=A0A9P5U0C3_9AGAR|nr:hypothetical protein BDP27DRAFT_1301314 [Rhodocollybia butyracea]
MFSRISTVAFYVLFAFAVLAAASPGYQVVKRNNPPPVTTTVTVTAPASTATIPASSCSTGPIQCCSTTQQSNNLSLLGSLLLVALGVVLDVVDGVVTVGFSCSGIDILNGGTCTAQAVCCEDNAIGGLVSIGCIPVTL